jgi:NADH-quinone oxidoreductase subunit N
MNAIITLSILALVVLYLGVFNAKKAVLPVTLLGLVVALGLTLAEWNTNAQPIFSGMMLFDNFAVAFSAICIAATGLILLISKAYFERISEHLSEYYAIILFALAGMLVMLSYHNLSMLFIGIEIMSVSLYILAGIKKKSAASNEASLKYFLMGAFSTGFLLFGITLLYGASGSFDLSIIKNYVLARAITGLSPMFYIGLLLLLVGLSFKIGAAPFHFWAPDVYEGSPSLITAFMSTVVKTAGFAAFLRIFQICFAPLHDFWLPVILVITIATLAVGNITAIYQHSFKRMLAYSGISHVGYLLFAVVDLGASSSNTVFVYATAYMVSTIAAFAVFILVKEQSGSDQFEAFKGLGKSNPFLAFCLTVSMLSLAGIPLTAGFIGKFMAFSQVLAEYHLFLTIAAVLLAVMGVFYYLKVVVAMYFQPAERKTIAVPTVFKWVLACTTIISVLIGIYPNFISNLF